MLDLEFWYANSVGISLGFFGIFLSLGGILLTAASVVAGWVKAPELSWVAKSDDYSKVLSSYYRAIRWCGAGAIAALASFPMLAVKQSGWCGLGLALVSLPTLMIFGMLISLVREFFCFTRAISGETVSSNANKNLDEFTRRFKERVSGQ